VLENNTGVFENIGYDIKETINNCAVSNWLDHLHRMDFNPFKPNNNYICRLL
jgi:hypothetical protein